MGEQRKLKAREDFEQNAEYLKSRLEMGKWRQRQKKTKIKMFVLLDVALSAILFVLIYSPGRTAGIRRMCKPRSVNNL